jgi:hypothetical protein
MSRCSQRSGLSTVAQRSFMQVAGSIPEAGSLLRSVLLQQVQDLKLKLGNGALDSRPNPQGLAPSEEPLTHRRL